MLIPSLAATKSLAVRLAPLLQPGDLMTLDGPLGAGKTAFARFLIQEFGIKGEIPSPTFTLVQSYETLIGDLFHFDLYRLKSADELEEIGWFEALADGIVLAEWPERAGTLLPRDYLKLSFTVHGETQRSVAMEGFGSWKARLTEAGLA